MITATVAIICGYILLGALGIYACYEGFHAGWDDLPPARHTHRVQYRPLATRLISPQPIGHRP